jgi:alpha-beta hydrolase superfamily lysophospholipase
MLSGGVCAFGTRRGHAEDGREYRTPTSVGGEGEFGSPTGGGGWGYGTSALVADRAGAARPESTSLRAADGVELALHAWTVDQPRAAIFYIHGIQSHAGWLAHTASALRAEGVSLYALDRRGSGRSGGPRGHLPSLELLLDDYLRALREVRAAIGGCALVALGQSLGASVLAGMWVTAPLLVQALVFSAPALGQQRGRHDAGGLARLRGLSGTRCSPIGLRDDDYTGEPEYLEFLAADPLMLREVTDQTRATLVRLEDSYMERRGVGAGELVFLGVPRSDPIIDLAVARAVLAALAGDYRERSFCADRHYLEFTGARGEYRSWLLQIAIQAARG